MSTEPDFGKILHELAVAGKLEKLPGKDAYRLTDQGEAEVTQRILGGTDIANLGTAFLNGLKQHGDVLGPVGDDWLQSVQLWAVVQRCAQLAAWAFRERSWEDGVTAIEEELLVPAGYFSKPDSPGRAFPLKRRL